MSARHFRQRQNKEYPKIQQKTKIETDTGAEKKTENETEADKGETGRNKGAGAD